MIRARRPVSPHTAPRGVFGNSLRYNPVMVASRPHRIAVATEASKDAGAIQALLISSPTSPFQADALTGCRALEDALRSAAHDAYLVQGPLLDRPGLLARLVGTGRPVVILAAREDPVLEAACLEAGAWDCLALPSLTPALLTRTVLRGIQHARLAEAKRRRLTARKMEAVGRFAGAVAHDFNNLLTAMLGYAELLRDTLDPDDDRRDDVAEIQRAGERATALTRQLLTFGLRNPVQPKILHLDEIVQRLSAILPPVLGNGVQVQVVTAAGADTIRADASQIELMILNLARNAAEAMPAGGRLRLETAAVDVRETPTADDEQVPPGHYSVLLVADEGTGMTPEVMSHLFEPFFTTKAKGTGTGLGLPVVYGIVKQAAGHITVDSTPGRGTTVRVYFPVAGG